MPLGSLHSVSDPGGCADDVRVEARGAQAGACEKGPQDAPPPSPQRLQTARPAGDTPGKVQFTFAHRGDCPQVMCCVTKRRP